MTDNVIDIDRMPERDVELLRGVIRERDRLIVDMLTFARDQGYGVDDVVELVRAAWLYLPE